MTKTLKTISGNTIKVTPNHSARTFTIRKNGLKYRTVKQHIEEFTQMCRHWTGNDWQNFLNYTNEYYQVK